MEQALISFLRSRGVSNTNIIQVLVYCKEVPGLRKKILALPVSAWMKQKKKSLVFAKPMAQTIPCSVTNCNGIVTSKGYICNKCRTLAALHGAEARLRNSLIKTQKKLEQEITL